MRARAHWRTGASGQPRRWTAALCAKALERGLVHAPRDIAALHRALIDAGHAHAFGAPLDTTPHAPLRELDLVAERVRALVNEHPAAKG